MAVNIGKKKKMSHSSKPKRMKELAKAKRKQKKSKKMVQKVKPKFIPATTSTPRSALEFPKKRKAISSGSASNNTLGSINKNQKMKKKVSFSSQNSYQDHNSSVKKESLIPIDQDDSDVVLIDVDANQKDTLRHHSLLKIPKKSILKTKKVSAEPAEKKLKIDKKIIANLSTPDAQPMEVTDVTATANISAVSGTDTIASDPKAVRVTKKVLKEKRNELKLKKRPNYQIVIKAKRIWEILRNRKVTKEKREELIQELYEMVKGKVKEFIFAHDAVRIIQCLMALKNEDIRNKLFEEVKDEILLMSKSKYARFFVIKMIKYGTHAHRDFIIKSFYGHVTELMRHNFAAEVVEYAYNEYANAQQRSMLASEFYGPEYVLFKGTDILTLDGIIAADPVKGSKALTYLKDHLNQLSTKTALKHSLVHRLLHEFLRNCNQDMRTEMIDSIKERIIEVVHTRDGALSAMYCIWHATAKERKIIVKTMKNLVTKICLDEFGYLVILAIFDSVDDTVLVSNVIIKEIKKSVSELLKNKFGLKVIHYLLSARDPHHFLPDTVKLLAIGDSNKVSKKDKMERRRELLEKISPCLITQLGGNLKEMILDPPTSMLTQSIIEHATGDKSEIYKAISELAAEEFIPCNADSYHLIEHSQGHFVLKHILELDKLRHANNELTLSELLIERLSNENFHSWIACNKGAFILVKMIETEIPIVVERLKSALSSSRNRLKSYSFAGAKILQKKLFSS